MSAHLLPVAAIVAVPNMLVVICFVALMTLGVYLILKAVLNPPKGGQSNLNLFGSKVSLKGPAWLIMLVIGAVMTASPVLAAVLQNDSSTPFQPPAPARIVAKIEEPDYQNFRFIDDMSYLDLRNSLDRPWYSDLPGWKLLAPKRPKIRPATLTNSMRVRKVGPAGYLHINYSTSGSLDLRCLTHPYEVRKSEAGKLEIGEIVADVRSIPVGAEFTLITEVTYWNAFSGAAGDDYTTYTHEQPDESEHIGVVLIFPDRRPFRQLTAFETPPGSEQQRPFQGDAQTSTGPENRTFYWATTTPGHQWFFTIKWVW